MQVPSEMEDGALSPRKRPKLNQDLEDDDLGVRFREKADLEEPTTFFVGDDADKFLDDHGATSDDMGSSRSDIPTEGTRAGYLGSPNKGPQMITESPDSAGQTQMCPICTKMLETDNDGLNAHIDFCLSKGAIREATKATVTSPRKVTSANRAAVSTETTQVHSTGWDALFKPASKGNSSYSLGPATRKGARSR